MTKAQELADQCATGYPLAEDAIAAAAELRRLDEVQALNVKLLNWVEAAEQKAGTLQRRLNAAEAERDALRAENAQLREVLFAKGPPLWTPAEFAAALADSAPIGVNPAGI
jgi:hypothetical protein